MYTKSGQCRHWLKPAAIRSYLMKMKQGEGVGPGFAVPCKPKGWPSLQYLRLPLKLANTFSGKAPSNHCQGWEYVRRR